MNCQKRTLVEMTDCVRKIMDQERDNLTARTDATLPDIVLSRRDFFEDHTVHSQLSFTNIRVQHASNIQLRDPKYNVEFAQGSTVVYIFFRCYWQPNITFLMDAEFDPCDAPAVNENCEKSIPHTITLPSAEFTRIWWKEGLEYLKVTVNSDNIQSGNMTFNETDIDFDNTYFGLVDLEQQAEVKSDLRLAVSHFMSKLSVALDGWFDNDVFPRFSAEIAR